MGLSIQDYLKKINSRLSLSDTVSVAVASFFLVILALYVVKKEESNKKDLAYFHEEVRIDTEDERPFGSRKGATYTYSWCSGADTIKPANKIFFIDAEEAERSGRTLSKLCQR